MPSAGGYEVLSEQVCQPGSDGCIHCRVSETLPRMIGTVRATSRGRDMAAFMKRAPGRVFILATEEMPGNESLSDDTGP